MTTIDTLKVARRLRDAGFSEPQAEAVVSAVQEGSDTADLVTKRDLDEQTRVLRAELKTEIGGLRAELKTEIGGLRAELKAGIAELRAEVRSEFALVRAEMRELGQRMIARIEAANAALMNRVVGLILGSVLVNVVTILGAMFAAVRLLAH